MPGATSTRRQMVRSSGSPAPATEGSMADQPITLAMAQRVIGRLTLEKELLAEALAERDRALRELEADVAELRASMETNDAAEPGREDQIAEAPSAP